MADGTSGWRRCLQNALRAVKRNYASDDEDEKRSHPSSPAPSPAEALAAAVREWDAAVDAAPADQLLAIVLTHKYTDGNLSVARLEGNDAAVVELLRGCELVDTNLAIITSRVGGGGGTHPYGGRQGGGGPRKRRKRGNGNKGGESQDSDDSDSAWEYALAEEYKFTLETRWVQPSSGHVFLPALDKCIHQPQRLLDSTLLYGFGEPYGRPYYDGCEDEGYGGNRGPNPINFHYIRAVAVIWPRARRATVVCAAGLDVALEALEQRLAGLAPRGGGQHPQQQAQQDAVQLLEAVLVMLENDAASGMPAASWGGGHGGGAHVAQALRVLTSRPALALLGGRGSALAVRLVERMSRAGGMETRGAVPILAAAASALSDPGFEDAVASLVGRHALKQFGLCMQLATSPAMTPSLRSRVGQALIGAALGSDFSRAKHATVLRIMQTVFGGAPCFRAHAAAFSAAVLARQDCQALLPKLLQDPVVAHGAAAGEPHAVALVAERVRALEEAAAPPAPVFSWAQPHAKLAGFPNVLSFLRGPDRQRTFAGMFTSLTHAKSWAAQHFGAGGGGQLGYSATAEAAGRGKGAYCCVTKTKALFQKADNLHTENAEKLAKARAMLPSSYGTGHASARCPASAPAAPKAGVVPEQAWRSCGAPLMDLTGHVGNQAK